SFIALELIFEHRMYMPSMFLILAIVAWGYRIVPGQVNGARFALCALVLLLAFFTWQRNSVWQNEITLWTDVVEKSPGSLRGHANLGVAYNEAKKYDLAQQFLVRAVAIGQDDRSGNFSPAKRQKYLAKAHDSLGMIYREMKKYPQAIYEANLALQLDPSRPDPLVTLGIVYARLDQHQRAYEYFKAAQAKGLTSIDLYNNWAVSSFNLGMVDQAITLLRYALQLDPEHPESHYNLGIAYSSKGMLEEAQREMNAAMQLRKKALQGKQSRF
ncbi:MAG: tetratricopeptide repeat protein, partial [Proteobacteria bacterium]|nr:tetratricopeptide repeat protein [Pseudomonadota bacterium]